MSDKELTISEQLWEKKEGEQTNETLIARMREMLDKVEKFGDLAKIKNLEIEFVVDGRETSLRYYNY